ncbi:MAG: S24 family peptidase [Trueperaceae bacterium]|jgi:repressor LexA
MATPSNTQPLSPAQERVYQRLLEHRRNTGEMPDLSELARGMGVHYVTLKQHLEALQTKGYLTFESRGRGRSPRLELPAEATGIPLVGDIPAGSLGIASAHVEAYLPNLAASGALRSDFALRVSGYSMADLIQPDDIVLLAALRPSRSGQICAVRVGEDEVTLKYLDSLPKGQYQLRPHNPDYPTVTVHGSELSIDGVYRGLLRGSVAESLLLPN